MFIFNKIKITKINSFRFCYSVGYAMNANEVFALKLEDGQYIATFKKSGLPEENAIITEVDELFEQKLEELLNKYKVANWDGFNKSNKYVLDGNSFDLSIRMEGNNNISASGYMKWPKNYREFKQAINELFNK